MQLHCAPTFEECPLGYYRLTLERKPYYFTHEQQGHLVTGPKGGKARLCVFYSDVDTQQLRRAEPGRLVAQWLYRGEWPKGHHVHHRNGDPNDNRWENLIFPLARHEHLLLEGKRPSSVPLTPYAHRIVAA